MTLYILILLGFALLLYGGNVLVDGSVVIAKRLKVSPLLIGLTLVGFGTSTPELMTSLYAAHSHIAGISVGNVVGSNIANILLVLGVTALIHPITIDKIAFKRDGAFLLLSAGVLMVALIWGNINFLVGLIMCATLGYYVYYCYTTDKVHVKQEEIDATHVTHYHMSHAAQRELGFAIAKTIGGLLFTLIGAHLLVDNSRILAGRWGVSESVIGLSMVAVGTSLPELVTSIIASLKKQSALALGNVVGSNIYNALFILGVTALFIPVSVPANMTLSILIMMAVTVLLWFVAQRHKVSQAVGLLFIILYCVYLGYLPHLK